jgi:hypothetical protein
MEATMHGNRHETATLADISQIGDSPLLRVMSGESVSVEAHDRLIAIGHYEQDLD